MSGQNSETGIDTDLARLNELRELLLTTTDFKDRLLLTTEQADIRLRWNTNPVAAMSDEQLASQLDSLWQRIDAVQGNHIPIGNMGTRGGDGSGLDPRFIMETNEVIDENAGLDELLRLRDQIKAEQSSRQH